jgi:hypothetical protein
MKFSNNQINLNESSGDSSDGSDGIRRCVTTFYNKNYNGFELDSIENKHNFTLKNDFITE